jgi:hypothetical protein
MLPLAETLSRYYTCNHIKWITPHAYVGSFFTIELLLMNGLLHKDPRGGLQDARLICLRGTSI